MPVHAMRSIGVVAGWPHPIGQVRADTTVPVVLDCGFLRQQQDLVFRQHCFPHSTGASASAATGIAADTTVMSARSSAANARCMPVMWDRGIMNFSERFAVLCRV